MLCAPSVCALDSKCIPFFSTTPVKVEHLDNLAAHHSGSVEVTVLMSPGPLAQTARETLAEELARSPGERVTVGGRERGEYK